jgi:hypothetical protein
MLTGAQFERFSEALCDAFVDPARFARMLRFRLDKRLQNIIAGGGMEEIAFEVIQVAEAEGWTAKLLRGARESNPGNPFGMAPANAPSGRELERIIRETHSFHNVMEWRTKLGEIEGRVCRVEVTTNGGMMYGSGFLVGPDLVMTNHHVVAAVIAGERGETTPEGLTAKPAGVVLRFDYKRLVDGSTLNPGTEYRLSGDGWLVDSSPLSRIDFEPDPKTGLPSPEELDHALLRLSTPAGDEHVGGRGEPGSDPRGWVGMPKEPHAFLPGSALFIVQHPKGDPLQLALDNEAVRSVNGNGTRVTYRTNTLAGSSGSPCFNHNWQLVALHHSGDPDYAPAHKPEYNEGIPITAITALLERRQLSGVLGAQEP